MAALPTTEKCLELLASLAAPPHLLRHTLLVAGAAGALAGLCRADHELVVRAALLHDIGKAPGIDALLSARLRRPASELANLDHGWLGAALLRSLGPPFASCATAVELHPVGSVLTGRGPRGLEEQVVYLADKMVGLTWLGFGNRMADLRRRYGHLFDIRLCEAGATNILWQVARAASLSPEDLEVLVAQACADSVGTIRSTW